MQKQESDLITAAARCELLLDQLDLLRIFADEARGSGSVDKASLGAFCYRINDMMQVAGLGAVVVSPLAMISNFGSDSSLGIRGSSGGQRNASTNKSMLEQVDDAELPERQPNVLSYRVAAADLILALELTDPSGVSDRPHIFLRMNDSAGNSSLRLDFADLDHAVNFYEVIDCFVSSWERYIKFVPLALTLCSGNDLEFLSNYRVRSRLGRENINIDTKGRIVVTASTNTRARKSQGAKSGTKQSITTRKVGLDDASVCLRPIAKISKKYIYDPVDLAAFINANPAIGLHRDK